MSKHLCRVYSIIENVKDMTVIEFDRKCALF